VVKEGSWMVGGYDDLGHEAEVSVWRSETGQLVVSGRRFWEPRRFVEVVVPYDLFESAVVVVLSVVVDDWQYHLEADLEQIFDP